MSIDKVVGCLAYGCLHVRSLSSDLTHVVVVPTGRHGSSLLWTHTLRPFYGRPIALTQEGRSLVNDVCECVRD